MILDPRDERRVLAVERRRQLGHVARDAARHSEHAKREDVSGRRFERVADGRLRALVPPPERARRWRCQQPSIEKAAERRAARWQAGVNMIGEAEAPGVRDTLPRQIAQRQQVINRQQVERAFRRRYQRAQSAIRRTLESAPADVVPLRVLAVPCGIPRDMTELAATLYRENPALVARIEYHAMDIDPSVLCLARSAIGDSPLAAAHYHCGDALSAADYPSVAFHVVISTGLGDFLDDAELGILFANVYRALEPGGTFYTSASARDPQSDVLLRMVELLPHYRTANQLEQILRGFKWRALVLEVDETGLQTFVNAVK